MIDNSPRPSIRLSWNDVSVIVSMVTALSIDSIIYFLQVSHNLDTYSAKQMPTPKLGQTLELAQERVEKEQFLRSRV